MSAYAPVLPETSSDIRVSASCSLTRDEVMTAREVADLLKMPVSTIYQLAHRGSFRLGDLAVRGGS
jgi:hypothetical protein